MGAGDGAAVTAQASAILAPTGDGEAEIMVFDLPA
jgi:hypothetical protein